MKNEVILEEEEEYDKTYRIKMESLKLFFNQAVELLQKTGKYSGQVKYGVSFYGGIMFYVKAWWEALAVFEKQGFLRSPRRKYILAFNYEDKEVKDRDRRDRFAKKDIVIDIYDLEEYENIVEMLKPLAQRVQEETGLSVTLKKQPNVPNTLKWGKILARYWGE